MDNLTTNSNCWFRRFQKISFVVLFLLSVGVFSSFAWSPSDPVYLTNYTALQISNQLVAGTNLTVALQNAQNSGATNYTIAPGVYRLPGKDPFGGGYYPHGFTINASNVTVILSGTNFWNLWDPSGSTNCALIGPLTVDFDPLPFSQGQVLSYNSTNNTVTVQIMPGYPDPPLSGGWQNPEVWIYDTNGVWLPQGSVYYSTLTWQTYNSTNHTGVLTLQGSLGIPQPGQYIAIGWNGNTPLIYPSPSPVFNLTIQNVTSYAGFFGVSGGGLAQGQVNYTGLKYIRCPGTSRLLGGGGFNAESSGSNTTVTFNGCEFGSSWDDMMWYNSGSTYSCSAQLTGTEVMLNAAPAVGDTLHFVNASTFASHAYAQVVSCRPVSGQYEVTLNTNVNVAAGDDVNDLTGEGQLVVTNCYFHDAMVRVAFSGFASGLIASNTFERINWGLYLASYSGQWNNLVISNNVFINTPYTGGSAIMCGPYYAAPMSFPSDSGNNFQTNITIVGNTILNPNGDAIDLQCTTGFVISNNVISNNVAAADLGAGYLGGNAYGIDVFACAGGTVANNTFLNNAGTAIVVDGLNSTNIQVTGNLFNGSMGSGYAGSIIDLNAGSGLSLGENVVTNVGVHATALVQTGPTAAAVSGLANGIMVAGVPLTLVNQFSGLVLADPTNGTAGTQAVQQTGTGNDTEHWTLSALGNGYCALVCVTNGLVLGANGSATAGTPLVMETFTGAADQMWALAPVGNNNLVLSNSLSGLVATISTTSSGEGVVQQTYSGGAQQQWQLLFQPLNLVANNGGSGVVVSWSAVPGATSYSIERATSNGGPYSLVASGITGTSYADTSAALGTTYYYFISANIGGVTGPATSVVSAASTTVTPLDVWKTLTGTGNWSVAGNWSSGVPATTNVFTGLQFGNLSGGASYGANNDLAGNCLVNQLTLNNAASSTTITLQGNPISLAQSCSALPQINQSGSGGAVINNNVVLNAATTYANTGSGSLTVNGIMSGGGDFVVSNNPGGLYFTANNPNWSGNIYLNSGTLGYGINYLSAPLGAGTIYVGNTNGSANVTLSVNGNTSCSLPNTIIVQSGNTGNVHLGAWLGVANFSFGPVILGSPNGTGKSVTLGSGGNGNSDFSFIQDPPGLVGAGGTVTLSGSPLSFSGPNNYCGATVLLAGTVFYANADNAVPAASAVLMNNGSTFVLNGYNDTIGSLAGTGTVSVALGNLQVGQNSASTVFAGAIYNNPTNGGTFTKIGTGTLTLRSTNNCALVASAGTLALAGGTLDGSLQIANGAVAQILANPPALVQGPAIQIAQGGQLYLANGVNLTVSTLATNGLVVPAGTWGSTASAAAHQNNTYFSGPGILTVTNTLLAPTSLTAVPNYDGVSLNWPAVSGAVAYNVKRSVTSGGPYATVGAYLLGGTTFNDTTAAYGITYYYIVTAVSGGGESGSSPEASASPYGALSSQILWSPPTAITTADAMLTQPGLLRGAATFGAAALTVTLSNGTNVNFTTNGSVATTTGAGTTNALGPISPSTGNANFDALLSEGNYDNGPKTITIYNLIPGHQYSVLLVGLDDRSGPNSRTAYFQDPVNPNDVSATFAMGQNVYVKGVFIASSTNQTIIEQLPDGGFGNLNLLVVYDQTQPITWHSPVVITTADATLNQPGTLMGAETFGGTEEVVTLTNGATVDFETDGSVASYSGPYWTEYGGFNFSGTANANFNAVVSEGNYNAPSNVITINNLVPGRQYSVLLCGVDDRNAAYGSDQIYYQDAVFTNDFSAKVSMGTNAYLTGSFTAQAPTQAINDYFQGAYGGTFSFLVVDDVTPTLPAPPAFLNANATNAQINLTWSGSTGAESYSLQRGTINGGAYTRIASLAVTNYTDTSVIGGTTYYYVVTALNAAGESADSPQAVGTLPSLINPTPTNLVWRVTASNTLALSWPADHTGWRLLVQTNSLNQGLSTNWFPVAGSASTNQFNAPLNRTNGSVFYRLIYP